MPKADKHPYCCDEFAELTNEFRSDPEEKDECGLYLDGFDEWVLYTEHGDYIVIDNVRFCPFCGTKTDTSGLEWASWKGRFLSRRGRKLRWRDLAPNRIYEVDDGGNTRLVPGKPESGEREFRKKPDKRPLIVDGVETLWPDGQPVIMDDIKRSEVFTFDPETRVIKRHPGWTPSGPMFLRPAKEDAEPDAADQLMFAAQADGEGKE
jgi:hypothetical protein